MVVTVSNKNGIKQYNISTHMKVILLIVFFLVFILIGSLSFYVKSLHEELILLENRIKIKKIVEKPNDSQVRYFMKDSNISTYDKPSFKSNIVVIESLKIKQGSEKLGIIALNKLKDEKQEQKQILKKKIELQRKKSLQFSKEREEYLEKETALQLAKLAKEKSEKKRLERLKHVEAQKRKERLVREKKQKMLKLQVLKKARAKKRKLARLKKEKEETLKKEKLARQRKLAKIVALDKEETIISKIDSLPKIAKSKLGKRYVWGAIGPSVFDCSGFTSYVYKKKGISIPRTSRQQSRYGKLVDRKHLKPGDLIFFDTSHRRKGIINHVGMYLGNNQFIHASSAKKRVVITRLNNFYSQRFKWARRVMN